MKVAYIIDAFHYRTVKEHYKYFCAVDEADFRTTN